MKALIASLVFVGSVAAGMLLLAGQFLAAPVRVTRLGMTPPTTANVALLPPEIAELPTREVRSAPPPSPTTEPAVPTAYPARNFSAVLPTQPATRTATQTQTQTQSLPTRTPTVTLTSREGCDSAYPDEATCIPPGPPFDQGCAMTEERRFTVLPPDPQRLDHDQDGIGCEPVE